MFENNSPDAEIKVIDFGLSRKFLPDDRYMTEGVGTFYTMAPQVLQGVYTSQADLWSCGVISFMLLSSVKPFHHKNRSRLVDKIMRAEYSFEGIVWEMISDDAKDFVANLLVLDPKKRMTAAMALEHPWFHHKFNLEDRRPSEEIMDGVAHNLLKYKYTSELKKVALNVIAHKSSTEEIVELRKAFDQYDSTNDGIIAYDEFKSALASSHLKEEDFRTIFESVDVNHNGVINYTEFLAATLEVKGYIEEERIAEAFERMDTDHDGYITRENLARLLGEGYTPQRADALIKEADTNKDGKRALPSN
jgi:calcium-dependent protein kinase